MKWAVFIAPVLALLVVGRGDGVQRGSVPPPDSLMQLDFDDSTEKTVTISVPKVDQLIQICVIRTSANKDQQLKTLKVQITGDSMSLVGITQVPAFKLEDGKLVNDPTKKNLSCFVQSVKKGKFSIEITPIGADGKEKPSRTWIGHVSTPAPNFKAEADPAVPEELYQILLTGKVTPTPVKLPRPGCLMQFILPGNQALPFGGVRVETTGDAIENVGVVEVPLSGTAKAGILHDKSNPAGHNMYITVLVRAVNTGAATVSISAVGVNGKVVPNSTKTWHIQVGAKNP